MRKTKITLAQIPEQKDLTEIKSIIKKKSSSDLIVFPESTLSISSPDPIKALQEIAAQQSTAVVIGAVYQKGKQLYNYAYYISADKIESYQKIHVHWTEKFVPGKEFKVIKTPFGRIGLLICYDASFQESGRVLALMGAEIIVIINVVPADFPYRISLLRSQAMALNNQVYVADCCKPGRDFTGHGAIFDPYGKELTELGKYQSTISRTIDLDIISKWRKQEKIFSRRKPKLYKAISDSSRLA